MSSISVNTITDASGGATTSINGFTPSVSNMAGRNRIINGDMRIDQRNAGAAVTDHQAYPVDRWQKIGTPSASLQRSTTAPSGFTNSLLLTVTATGDASSTLRIQQHIEGFNVSDLGWGTASAQNVTVSFSVNCSVTGTYSLRFSNSDGNRVYFATFVVNSANTWEYKTLTIPGDTTGTWLTNNGRGISLAFVVAGATAATPNAWGTTGTSATGQINLCLTNGATFYITGVQLEEGSVATPFCPAGGGSYGAELALCQRYYWRTSGGGGSLAPTHMVGFYAYSGSSVGQGYCAHPVTMRANPTSTISSLSLWNGSSVAVTSIAATNSSTIAGTLNLTTGSGSLSGYYNLISPSSGIGYVDFSAEL